METIGIIVAILGILLSVFGFVYLRFFAAQKEDTLPKSNDISMIIEMKTYIADNTTSFYYTPKYNKQHNPSKSPKKRQLTAHFIENYKESVYYV